MNEKTYTISLKHTELRELQRALLYHIDTVMIPYLEAISKEQDYNPTMEVKEKILILQRILCTLNKKAGPFREDME